MKQNFQPFRTHKNFFAVLLFTITIFSCDELEDDLSIKSPTFEEVNSFRITQPNTSVLFDLQSAITSETTLSFDVKPNHGELTLIDGRFLKYEPQEIFSGTDNFKISATSSGNTQQKEFGVEMNDGTTSLPPTFLALSDYYYFNVHERTELIFNPLINDGYEPSLVSSVSVEFSEVSDGELLAIGGSEYKYTPPTGFIGIVSFIYTLDVELSSGENHSSSAQIVINVTDYDQPCFETKWQNQYLEFFTPFEETYLIQIVKDQPDCVEALNTQITNINEGTAVLTDDHRFILFTPPQDALGKDIKIDYIVELPTETLSIEIGINMLEP